MNKLRFWRLECCLSQFELAEAAEVPRYVIQLAEQGIRRPSPDEQGRIAEALGAQIDSVFPPPKDECNLPPADKLNQAKGTLGY